MILCLGMMALNAHARVIPNPDDGWLPHHVWPYLQTLLQALGDFLSVPSG